MKMNITENYFFDFFISYDSTQEDGSPDGRIRPSSRDTRGVNGALL